MRAGPNRRRWLVGALLATLLAYQWQTSSEHVAVKFTAGPAAMAAEPIAPVANERGAFAALLQSDPIAAFHQALDFHRRSVQDYRCTFVKQELLVSGMSTEQTIDVKFRPQPYSVFMHWIKNQDKAVRVIYEAGRWRDEKAVRPEERELAVCQPGAVAQLFVKSVKQPIRGPRAKDASRRYIDDFGFDKALSLMIEFSQKARDRNELKLTFDGASEFDGRPTWVLCRHVPFDPATKNYPDATAIYHIDQEWRVPVAIYSYGDNDQKQLLGRYEYRDIRMNAGLTRADFDPSTYGM